MDVGASSTRPSVTLPKFHELGIWGGSFYLQHIAYCGNHPFVI